VAKPLILGFDIEVNSTNPSAMPNANKPGDKSFQISCVLYRHGDNEKDYDKHLLTLGDPDPVIVGKDVTIHRFGNSEAAVLTGFAHFIRKHNPNLIVGYNILGFDIPYMIARAKLNMCIFDFDKQGFHKFAHAQEKTIKWSSSAYKNQEFQFLDAEGRVYVDLLPLVRRDYKFSNYKLKTVADAIVGQTKDDLSPKGIFKCYRIGMKVGPDGKYGKLARKAMGIVGKYCVQDSALVCLLMDKLQTWVGLTEMAKTCNVPIFTLYTQGQQIKVFSQLYKFCLTQNIVVEKDGYQVGEHERYLGAHVFPPVPGRYKNVVPFDFASLYPNTIIAFNIDYHTWVSDDSDIPDEKCHVMDWEEHMGCEHDPKIIRKKELDRYIEQEQKKIKAMREKRNGTSGTLRKKEMMEEIKSKVEELSPYVKERSEINKNKPKFPMCNHRHYRFLKEPRGVLPTILKNLLDARAHTREVDQAAIYKEIDVLRADAEKDHKAEITDLEGLNEVLNKRQLSYKISANSMYGAMGVRRGYLPFMPGAMCTTYMGRISIKKVADTITKKYGGELVMGDTDSTYVHFAAMEDKSLEELWDWAVYVSKEITKLFPPPMKLEFENAIYAFFFILTKKRYMHRVIKKRGGKVSTEIGKKGVLLARRDNSKFVRDIYEGVISRIADNTPRDEVLYWILQQINLMFANCKPYTDFIITKSVGDYGNLQAEAFVNEKGVKKAKVGQYTVPLLSTDKTERQDQMDKKGATSTDEYYLLCLPAVVQLAERMKVRGQRVDPGSRLEYVVTDPERHTAKQYEKVEDASYYHKYPSIIKIDYFYYLKALANPLDQMLNIAYGRDPNWQKDFVLEQYNIRWKRRYKCLMELKTLFQPKIVCVDDVPVKPKVIAKKK
jgi:DNA polymerase elongation subunit (family B)